MYFPLKLAKFLKIPILKNICEQLLLLLTNENVIDQNPLFTVSRKFENHIINSLSSASRWQRHRETAGGGAPCRVLTWVERAKNNTVLKKIELTFRKFQV